MAAATLVRQKKQVSYGSADELREVFDQLLTAVDADERIGPLLGAARLRARLEFEDLDVALNLASAERKDCCIEWDFDARPAWRPKLTLTMDSAIANRYLQGAENIAIAIARGWISCSGESRGALVFIPAVKLLVEPYRRIIDSDHPHLRVD